MASISETVESMTDAPVASSAVPPPGSVETLRSPAPGPAEVTVSLFDFVQKLVRGRWLLLWVTVLGIVLGVVVFFFTPAYFVAEAAFLPPQQQQPSMLSALSLFQSQAQNDSTDTYLALLASRSVTDDVVHQTHVMERFKTTSPLTARSQVLRMSKFAISRNQLITVTVKDPDPGFAAAVANAYLDALYRQNGAMVTSASSHREQFFRQQLGEQKEDLARAETDLRLTQEQTGLVLPEGEAAAGLSTVVQLQQQINEAQTRLAGLLAGATEQNPQVIQAREELATLRSQLARQQATTGVRRPGGGIASTSELPALTLQNLRRQRELKLQETLYQSLTEQYQKARLSSTDPGPQLQIVDHAIRAERKAGPHGRYYAAGGGLLGLVAGLAYLLLAGPVVKVYRSYQRHSRERGVRTV